MELLHILQASSIPDLMDHTSQFSFVPWVPHRPWPGHHWGPKTWLMVNFKRISPGNGSWLGSNHQWWSSFPKWKRYIPRAWPSLHPGFMSNVNSRNPIQLGTLNMFKRFNAEQWVPYQKRRWTDAWKLPCTFKSSESSPSKMSVVWTHARQWSEYTYSKPPRSKSQWVKTSPGRRTQSHAFRRFTGVKTSKVGGFEDGFGMLTSPDATHKYGKPAAGEGGLSFRNYFIVWEM